ncbi:MAG TPA: hypothetical protein VG755_21055 [Nannocystaceae bacterium]|nr:hypothetical protein [Nannocystaceae bacterium]
MSACGAEDEGETTAATTMTTSTTMSTTDASAGSEEDSGDEDPTSDPSTTASTSPGTTDPSTTTPAEDSGDEDPGTTTDVAEETGPAEESSTGVAGSPCDPDPMGDPCDECTKMNCCPQLETCFDDPICVCMSGCVMGFADFEPCTQMCGQTANFMPVTDCAASMCLLECIG